jgi:hypothetical protein
MPSSELQVVAKTFSPQALEKLEKFLIAGTEQALSEGYTIVCRCYNPREKACDPIYAACLAKRTDNTVQFDWQLPSFEQILNDAMGEPYGRFDWTDLKALMHGIDSDKPFMHHTFYLWPHRNEGIFDIGRRLRYQFIGMPGVAAPELLSPEYAATAQTVACISETEAAQYAETGELSSPLFAHINSCKECRGKLEVAKEWQPVELPLIHHSPELPVEAVSAPNLTQQVQLWERQQIENLMDWFVSSLRSAQSWFQRTMWGAR